MDLLTGIAEIRRVTAELLGTSSLFTACGLSFAIEHIRYTEAFRSHLAFVGHVGITISNAHTSNYGKCPDRGLLLIYLAGRVYILLQATCLRSSVSI